MKNLFKFLSLGLVLLFIVTIAVLSTLDIRTYSEPPLVLPILNTLFACLIPVVVAYIAARSYIISGSTGIILMGCGLLTFGLGAASAGWLRGISGGANVNVTIYNTAAFLGAILHALGASMASRGVSLEEAPGKRRLKIVSAYSGVIILVALLTVATLQGVVPPFFLQGVGPTLLRQVVLGTAIVLFVFSSFFFMTLYSREKQDFLYWYSLTLLLMGLSLFAFFIQKAVGSPIGWVGRSSQYVAGIYALIAILTTVKSSRAKGISLERAITGFFSEAEESYKALVESANDAIVTFDQEERIILWNSSAERLFGYSRGEAVGSRIADLIISEELIRFVREQIVSLMNSGEGQLIGKTTETIVRRKDGRMLPVGFTLSTRRTQGGWIISTWILRDITEQKVLEQRVQERTAQLEAANEELEAFSYSVSHDLKAPLRAISGFAQIIERRYRHTLNEEASHYFDNIITASERMGILINELLEYSRVGRGAISLQPVSLKRIIIQVLDILSEQVKLAGAELSIPEDLPVVSGDAGLLRQVFTNILDNAIVFRRKNVPLCITIGCRDENNNIIVSVTDNGIGIPEEYCEKVFNMFQRLHSDEEYPGTGIGLAIVMKVVKLMNGQVWVESTPEKGSVFYVKLRKE